MGCFLQLRWPLPNNLLDLFVEHKLSVNGLPSIEKRKSKYARTGKAQKSEGRDNLLGALAIRGLAHIDADDKEAMRELILTENNPTREQQKLILNYCVSDVIGTEALLRYMLEHGEIDRPRALCVGNTSKLSPKWSVVACRSTAGFAGSFWLAGQPFATASSSR